jgi:hypothetical protein
MFIKTASLVMIFFSMQAHAFKDSLLLAEIAATLAKDLQHTLKLLEIADEQQQKLFEVHNNIETRRLLANRVIRKMEYVQSLQNIEIHDLRSFNMALAELKHQYKDAEAMKSQLAKSLLLDEMAQRRIEIAKDGTVSDGIDTRSMRNMSFSGSYEESGKNTAINTSITNDILNEQRKDNLEFQSRVINEIQRNKEREFVEEERRIQTQKFYGVDHDIKFWEARR